MRYRQTSDNFRSPSRSKSKYRGRAAEVVVSTPVVTDKPRLSFTVMAHKKRQEWAEQVASDIGCDITWDRINDRHDTGLRAIKAYDPDATHHVVVQDDVHFCDNFVDIVTEAARYPYPLSPMGLYYGGTGTSSSAHSSAGLEADRHNASWIVRKGPVWGPAIVYPTGNILALIDYFESSTVENYDRRVMEFYRSQGIDCWYTNPSLVDHRQENNPSLCNHDRGTRVARRFLGPQEALEVDWSGPVVKANW